MRPIQLLSVLFLLILATACTLTIEHTPEADTFNFHAIPEFTSQQSITLINAQPDTSKVLFSTFRDNKWLGNMNKWTNVALEITSRELQKRGMEVTDSANKRLSLSIISASTTSNIGHRGFITLEVITHDGTKRTYYGEADSPVLYRTMDGAIMISVEEMLKDPEIVAYLKQ